MAPTKNASKVTWKTYFDNGMEQYKHKEYAAAVKSFRCGIDLGSKDFALHEMSAAAMSRLGGGFSRSALAKIEVNCRMFKREARVWKTWYLKADILYRAGDYRGANKALDDALPFTRKLGHDTAQRATATIDTLRSRIQGALINELARQRRAVLQSRANVAEAARLARIARTNYMGNLPEVVVVHIAGMLSKEQPDAHATMARVCPNWRWAILDEPRLWRSLTLDLRRPTDKARVFRYYSKKRLREIKFTDRFDSTRAPAISDILIDSVGHVKCLAVKQNQIGPAFQDQFRSLESLHLTGSAGNVLDLEFIHPTAVPIRDLKLASTMLSLVQPGQGGPDHLDSGVRTRLSTASSVTMSDSYVSLHTPDDRQDAAHAAFLQYLRSAREIFLENVFLIPLQFVPTGPNIPGGIVQNAVRIDLPLLEIYEEPAANFTSDRPLFDLVHAPNLQKLLLWNLNAGFQARALDQLTAPGLAAALPNLVALDIGKSAVEQPQLLRVLNVMKSLRFLNVSFCGVDNGFLDAIQLKVGVPDSEQMLPHLTALSIAGHEAVTSAAVRDFLNSRLPGGEKIPVRVEKPATKGPSMFKPTAPKLDKGKGRAATQTSTLLGSQMRGPSMQSLRSIPVSTQPPSTYPLTQPAANLPVNPRIDWLNIDLCENVQATAVDWWRPKVRFLSHQPGAPDYDRIRGKGQWSWDSEWTEDCPRGEGERGCHLRKVPGRPGAWEIWHTCHARVEARLAALDGASQEDKETRKPGWFQMPKMRATPSTLDDA